MSDFGAGACDFHSDFASDFRDFPGDFAGDFGAEPRTAKQPPEAPRAHRRSKEGTICIHMSTFMRMNGRNPLINLGHSRRQGHRGIRTAASWQRKR